MEPFTIECLPGNIVHLNFRDQKTLCRYMVRIEEFYESPAFANTVFELADYIKWYQKEYGQWSYYSDWSGFNIPGNKLLEFEERYFTKMRGCEKQIFRQIPFGAEIYLVATYGDDYADILKHERAHAQFYSNIEYRTSATSLVEKHTLALKELSDWILERYNQSVLVDELQAYASTSDAQWFIDHNLKPLSEELMKEFADNLIIYLNPL